MKHVTITLNLTPELEAALLAQAQTNGMTLERYVLSVVEGAALSASKKNLSLRPSDWSSYLAEGPVASESFMQGVEDLPVQEREP